MELGQIQRSSDGKRDNTCMVMMQAASCSNVSRMINVDSNGTSEKRQQVECLDDDDDDDDDEEDGNFVSDEDEEGAMIAIRYSDIEDELRGAKDASSYGSSFEANKRQKIVHHQRKSNNFLPISKIQLSKRREEENQLFGDINSNVNDSSGGNSDSNSLCNHDNRPSSSASHAFITTSTSIPTPTSTLSSSSPSATTMLLVDSNSRSRSSSISESTNGNKTNSQVDRSNNNNNKMQQRHLTSAMMSPTPMSISMPEQQSASLAASAEWLTTAEAPIKILHTNSAPLKHQTPDLVHHQHEDRRQFQLNQQHKSSFAGLQRNQRRYNDQKQQEQKPSVIHNGHIQRTNSNNNRCDSGNNVPSISVNGEQREDEARRRISDKDKATSEQRPMIGHHHQHAGSTLQQQSTAPNVDISIDKQQEIAKQKAITQISVTQAATPSPTFMSTPISSSSSISSSTSSSISSSLSNLSSSSSSGYQSPSMFNVQHRSNIEQQQQLQQVATNNFVATGNSNQLTDNHKPLDQQSHQYQQQQPHHHHHQQQQPPQQQPLQRQYPPNHPLGNTKHLCSICGDRATGKHYGVYSCEGCKGFFKRTIRKDIVYVCRANSDCLIDMRQRNRCQYCRYQKCLRQGMKREAVQEEKQRLKLRACAASTTNCDNQVESTSNMMIGHTQISSLNNSSTNHHLYGPSTNQNHHHHQYKPTDPHQIQLSEIVEAQLNVCDRNNSTPSQQHYDIYHQNSNHHQIDISPPTSITPTTNYQSSYHHHQPLSDRLPVMRDHSSYYNTANDLNHHHQNTDYQHQPVRKYSRIDDLTLKWAAQMQIEQLLDWAKSVPKFTELLIDDQITLLKAYWNELIISEIAFKSIDALKENQNTDHRSLCIGRGLYINQDQAYEIGLSNMFDRIIGELVVKMNDMRLDSNELACLRAIILFNPETQGLKTSQPIEEYRGNVYTALEIYCRKTYDEQPNRFGKLLLRLPALRSIGLKCDSMRRCDNNNNNNFQTSPEVSAGGSSPSGNSSSTTSMLGYQVKLLFFDICYKASAIDSFLRSSLIH